MLGRLARVDSWLTAMAVIIAVYLVGHYNGSTRTERAWQAKWDAQALKLAEAKVHAQEVARTEEQRRIQAIEEITRVSRKEIEQARNDAAAASATAERLHDQAERLARASGQCASNSSATTRSEAARATNALVLAELFKRADEAAGELAAAYDRARAAGLACERAYEAVRNANSVPSLEQ